MARRSRQQVALGDVNTRSAGVSVTIIGTFLGCYFIIFIYLEILFIIIMTYMVYFLFLFILLFIFRV